MDMDFLDTFQNEHYTPRLKQLFVDTSAWISENNASIQYSFTDAIDSACKDIAELQKKGLVPEISCLCISFLFTSLHSEMPQFQIDCYPEGWLPTGKSIYATRFDASWLTTYIEAFRQNLISDSQKDGTINLIPPEQVNIFVLRAVRDLLFYSVNIVKYFPDLDRAKNLFAMSRAEDFWISFGELGDWQRIVFAVFPYIDIFNCDEDTVLRFHSFPAITYRQKTFSNLDLTHSVFRDCTFIDCHIDGCIWNDCTFDNCTFKRTEIARSTFWGAAFYRCTLEATSFVQNTFHHILDESVKEMFRAASFIRCNIHQTIFDSCDLTGIQVLACDYDSVKVVGLDDGTVFPFAGRCIEEGDMESDGIL